MPLAVLLLTGGCAALGPPDVETSRVYGGVSQAALYERTLQALQASDLKVTAADRASGRIEAAGSFANRNWAECPQPRRLAQVDGDQAQVVAAREDQRRVELTASIEGGVQGATLTLDPDYSVEPVSALATTTECRTTGALERRNLGAVAAGA